MKRFDVDDFLHHDDDRWLDVTTPPCLQVCRVSKQYLQLSVQCGAGVNLITGIGESDNRTARCV
jgi:hypothetical protein